MKKWLTRWLALGLSLLFGIALTSCSGQASYTDQADSEQETHSNQPLDPSPATAGPLTLVDGPVSISPVDPLDPITTGEPQLPVTFTDNEGNDIEITDTSRVLALDIYGTFAETIIALGEEDKLVGRTVSDTQPQLADLPVVTVGGHELNAEAILNLAPTLVIADKTLGPPEVMEQIASAGIPIVYLSPERRMKDLTGSIMEIAEIMGVPDRGKELIVEREEFLAEVTAELAAKEYEGDEPPSAVFLYIRGTAGVFFVFGEGSGADDLIKTLGFRDVASEAGVTDYKPATAEALAEMQPDIIFAMTSGLESGGGIEGLLERPGVAQTPAGQNKRIIDLPDGQSLSFGPSYPDLIRKVSEEILVPVDGES